MARASFASIGLVSTGIGASMPAMLSPVSVVKINAITIPEGMGPELESRFAARAHAVENEPGFESFQLLRPVSGDTRYFVVTQWESDAAFEAWRSGQSFQHAHGQGGQPGGEGHKPPVGMSGDLLEFEVVDFPNA